MATSSASKEKSSKKKIVYDGYLVVPSFPHSVTGSITIRFQDVYLVLPSFAIVISSHIWYVPSLNGCYRVLLGFPEIVSNRDRT